MRGTEALHGRTPPAARGAAERFNARDGAGRVIVIEKMDTGVRPGDAGHAPAGVSYRLQRGGGRVERITESLFRVVSTEELVRRDETVMATLR